MKNTPPAARPFYRSSVFLGTVWGLSSALAYAVTNILLRELAQDTNAALVTCMKAVPTFFLACAMIGADLARRQFVMPAANTVLMLVTTALIVQFAGNLALQGAFGMIGLALTIPLSFGTLIVASAVMGRVWLLEPITSRMLLSMTLLVISIALLTLGAEESTGLPAASGGAIAPSWSIAMGVLLACVSGVAYSLIAVVIRSATRQTSVAVILLVVSVVGIATLAPTAIAQMGLAELWQTKPTTWGYMLLAGSCNAAGFYTLGKSLQLISVVHANLLNASQVAIAAVSGILLFGEPSNWAMMLGLVIGIVGLVVIRDESRADE